MRRDLPKRATLADVAQRLGMSRSTVSMALSDHPDVAVRTKERARAAAEELGYVTNSAARALRSQSSGSIALVIPDAGRRTFGHPYFMHLLLGVTDVASEHNSNVIISANKEDNDSVAAYEKILRSRGADGAIVTVAMVSDPHLISLVNSGIPVVLMGRFPHLPNAISVGTDDAEGSREITSHLINVHARRRLIHIGGPMAHRVSQDRLDGYRRALAAANLPHPPREWAGDFTEESGRQITREIVMSGERFDGLVIANDEMAYGAMSALRDFGKRVPEDISIVGFDDFGLARITTPAISTVRIPAEELARAATERLFALIAGVAPSNPHLILPLQLIIRESCGCHPILSEEAERSHA